MVSFPAAVIIRAITAQFIGIRKEKRKGKDGERGGWVGGRGGDGGGAAQISPSRKQEVSVESASFTVFCSCSPGSFSALRPSHVDRSHGTPPASLPTDVTGPTKQKQKTNK